MVLHADIDCCCSCADNEVRLDIRVAPRYLTQAFEHRIAALDGRDQHQSTLLPLVLVLVLVLLLLVLLLVLLLLLLLVLLLLLLLLLLHRPDGQH